MSQDDLVRRRIKAWLTDDVLRKGIREVDAWFTSHVPYEIRIRKWTKRGMQTEVYMHPDWHRTREEAVLYANKVRDRKVKQLIKQLTLLEDKTF